MLGIPRRFSHFVCAFIQFGLTCLIAAGIASLPSLATGNFFWNWLASWLIAWVTMLPIVLLAAPAIRSIQHKQLVLQAFASEVGTG
jgi:amino acid transporter